MLAAMSDRCQATRASTSGKYLVSCISRNDSFLGNHTSMTDGSMEMHNLMDDNRLV